MAKFPNITITQEGLNVIAKLSENKLIYTHIALGDGVLNKDDKILNFTDLKSKKLTADIADITNDNNSQITLQTIVSNKIVEKGFYAREIGIYAKLGENGKEFLYGYANAGNNADYMPDNTQPIDELKLKITLLVGNVENVTAVINSSIIFITLEDCRREIKKHNDDITAHGNTFARKKDVYTKSETDNLLKGKANTSHGNHVPKTETANNTRFLRNDNTWQTVTPANIGAPSKTGAGASGTWNINITGNSASAAHANNADVAKTLEVTDGVGAKSNGVFHWVGQNGQPAWLWGSNDGSNQYVYNPSNFHVAAANTATIASIGDWQGKNDNRWYQMAFSLDREFNWNSTGAFQYNPASNVLKVGTVQGNITGNANTASGCNGVFIVNPGNINNYVEGIRINEAADKWSFAMFGCPVGSTQGTDAGSWLVGVDPTDNFLLCPGDAREDVGLCLQKNTGNVLWNNQVMLHSGNYNNFAPTKTGAGASGTWNINITGNANTATNADTVDGYHASDLFRTLGGNRTPVMTDIFDRAGTIDLSAMNATDKARHKALINKSSNMTQNLWDNDRGIHAYGGDTGMSNGYVKGTLKLTQSYKNFDKILVVACNDGANWTTYRIWDTWELSHAFNSCFAFDFVGRANTYWEIYGSVRTGTATNYVLSTDTIWSCRDQNGGIIAIYGIKY